MRALVAAVLLALLAEVAATQEAAGLKDELLTGIWGSEMTFGPALRGELTVRREGADWRATIQSAETRFRIRRDSVRFAFAGNLGEFRGALTHDGRAISGFWVQPRGVVIAYPFATPLTLALTQRGTWRGHVSPLPDGYSVYLSVERSPTGALVGTFRNPELNHYGRFLKFRVARVRDSVIFAQCGETCATADSSNPDDIRLAAFLDIGNRDADSSYASPRLLLWWPPLNRQLVVTPYPDSQAIGLFPRVPRGFKYRYVAPPVERDGWRTDRASAVGLDESKLAALVQRIADTVPTDPRAPFIHSLLIARGGKLVLEEYFFGHDRDHTHDTRSIGKTFASVMLGAAMLRGTRIAPETPVASLLPAEAPFANPDPRKQKITLAHLMTHSSGLACDDNDETSPGNEDTMMQQTRQPNYWKYILDLPMAHDPGSYYAYCSGGMNLMSGALTAATRTWLPELFDRTVARPLQFGRYYFNLMPTLEGYLGGGAFLRPRDLLKIGQAYLDGGVWNGRRIVPQSWVTRSTSKQIEWPYRSENVNAGMDGYAWHLHTLQADGRAYKEYEANGNGGQLLIVAPELDLVVVFTAGNYGHGGVWSRFRTDVVPNAIIAAIQK